MKNKSKSKLSKDFYKQKIMPVFYKPMPKHRVSPLLEENIFYLPTCEIWSHGNFDRNCVQIRVSPGYNLLHENNDMYTIGIYISGKDYWNDTYGKIFEFPLDHDVSLAREIVIKEKNNLPNPISKVWLKEHGYIFI